MKDFFPSPPVMKLLQVVSAHDPDEADAGKTALELGEGVCGTAGAEQRFHGAGPQRRVARNSAGRREPLLERSHVVGVLQWVLRTDQQPDLVQPQPPQGLKRYMRMTLMRRIEGAAQQANLRPASWQVAAQS